MSRDSGFSPAIHYVSLSSIEQAEWLLRDYVNVKIPAKIKQGKLHSAYTGMVEHMEFYNLPGMYETDFYYHDTLTLSDNPDKFIWILRDGGTHIILNQCDWNAAVLDYNYNPIKYFIYNGDTFYQTDIEHAKKFYANSLA